MMAGINNRRKTGIQRKVASAIFLSVFIIMAMGIGLVYFLGLNLLRYSIGKEYAQISGVLGIYINKTLLGEIEDVDTYATRPLWIDTIEQANLKYRNMDRKKIKEELAGMDKIWASADRDAPVIKEYLDNRISISIRDILKIRKNIAQLFITDKFGGLVASSDKMDDFCQSDESWWIEAYNSGRGKTYVGDVEFDKSSGYWVMPIAVPLKDDNNDVIGICKVSISIQRLFGHLEDFKIGKTGHAVLVDRNGNILFHPAIQPMTTKYYFKDEDFKKIISGKTAYFMLTRPHKHTAVIFTAFSRVDPPILSDKGVYWTIFIDQDVGETLEPLNKFIINLIIVTVIMIIITIPVGFIFGEIFVKPIHKLHLATEEIVEGNWDYEIDINTGDEIEQLADAFKTMIAAIKNKQEELSVANYRLEDLLKNLEKKVEERTRDLTETQEATLNILEDLQETKKKLEVSNKELLMLDQLKSDFVSTVSHELRTPLSIVKEGVALVLDRIMGDVNEKQEKVLITAKDNIDRLTRIIDALLDISKIESGKIELKKGAVELTALINKVASSFEPVVKNKGLELKLDVPGKEVMCNADYDKLIQVFTNLIGNAVKFTDKGYIKISCADKGLEVECVVSDTGVGISSENIPKVFNKFQQFGRLAGPGEKGTGLGLSIAKGIIDLHGGRIRVDSELNKGTSFIFTLPKKALQYNGKGGYRHG